MRKILLALALCFSLTSIASPLTDCKDQIPYGAPQLSTSTRTTTIVCHTAYLLEHDNNYKIPVWVSYSLTPSHAIGCVKRSNAFTADPQLQVGQRAEVSDYVKTGYDKGHIANDGDMGWDVTVERESFLMSNMTPQLPAFNRGIWKILEVTTRSWATDRQHTLVIYAGPIYSKDDKKIGDNAVDVPNGFYKIIIDTVTNDVLAFQFPHAGASNSDISPFQTTVSNIERATGITFSIPQRKDLKSPIWDYQISSAAKAKKKACSI